VDGEVTIGPTAFPVGPLATLGRRGGRRMLRRHWRAGVLELRHAASRRAVVAAAARYVPELTAADVGTGFTGVRAQALAADGTLVDDFVFSATGRALHVRNAPSPGATSSLAIAERVADQAEAAL
jgi:L-2-hydroxyglutarate oxidase LhgO